MKYIANTNNCFDLASTSSQVKFNMQVKVKHTPNASMLLCHLNMLVNSTWPFPKTHLLHSKKYRLKNKQSLKL